MAVSTHRIHLPALDDDFVDEVLDELVSMRETLPEISVEVPARHASTVPAQAADSEFHLLVALVESVLDEEVDDPTPRTYAQLAIIALLPGVPEALALQVAFGRKVGVQHVRKMTLLRTAARVRGLTMDEYVAELVALGRIPQDRLVQLFLGRSQRSPKGGRMKRGSEVLRRVASSVPEGFRPPILCAVAWLHWAAGRRAIALAYLDESSRIDPGHILAHGLAAVAAERMPDWCVDKPGAEP